MRVFLVLILFCFGASAKDLTTEVLQNYKMGTVLSEREAEVLKQSEFYLIPGILSETFDDDPRSQIKLKKITKEYFRAQLKLLKDLGVSVHKLPASSSSVEETRTIIREVLGRKNERKLFFITHSLGGLALLEELIGAKAQHQIAGIIFLQAPFWGAPMADVYLRNPYYLRSILKPVLPFLNTSEETIKFLSVPVRKQFMELYSEVINSYLKTIPVLTVSGVANGYRSLFRPSLDIMKYGCVKLAFGRCLTPRLYDGPYDDSDGMVPLESSLLESGDRVILKGVDHGETVVQLPYSNFDQRKLTTSLLRTFLQRNLSNL